MYISPNPSQEVRNHHNFKWYRVLRDTPHEKFPDDQRHFLKKADIVWADTSTSHFNVHPENNKWITNYPREDFEEIESPYLEEGKYYYAEDKDGFWMIGKILDSNVNIRGGQINCEAVLIASDKRFEKVSWCFYARHFTRIYRKATEEEKEWLDACIKANKYIPKEEVKSNIIDLNNFMVIINKNRDDFLRYKNLCTIYDIECLNNWLGTCIFYGIIYNRPECNDENHNTTVYTLDQFEEYLKTHHKKINLITSKNQKNGEKSKTITNVDRESREETRERIKIRSFSSRNLCQRGSVEASKTNTRTRAKSVRIRAIKGELYI